MERPAHADESGNPRGAIALIPAQGPPPSCVTTDIYANWIAAGTGGSHDEQAAIKAAESERPRINGLNDPFTAIAQMKAQERAAANERVLWEDTDIMVLVDRFASMELLVVPKAVMSFLFEAPPALRVRLGRIADAAADGFIAAEKATQSGERKRVT